MCALQGVYCYRSLPVPVCHLSDLACVPAGTNVMCVHCKVYIVTGAFLIPYVICLIFMGIPLFALEISFGQFGGKGPLTIWDINPVARGRAPGSDCKLE